MGKVAGGIADEGGGECLAGATAERERGGGAREIADVQAIEMTVAGVGHVADLNQVFAVGGREERDEAVVAEERSVVGCGDRAPGGVLHRDDGIEHGATETRALDLGGEAAVFFASTEKKSMSSLPIVPCTVVFSATGWAFADSLLGSFFFKRWKRADVENAQRGNAAGGAQAQGVFAEAAVGGNGDEGFHLFVGGDNFFERETRGVEEDFLRIGEAVTAQRDFDGGAALGAGRGDGGEVGGDGEGGGGAEECEPAQVERAPAAGLVGVSGGAWEGHGSGEEFLDDVAVFHDGLRTTLREPYQAFLRGRCLIRGNRGGVVFDGDGVGVGLAAGGVGGAVDVAAFHAAAGESDAEDFRPVVAAGGAVDLLVCGLNRC